jgi:hypothetical protein
VAVPSQAGEITTSTGELSLTGYAPTVTIPTRLRVSWLGFLAPEVGAVSVETDVGALSLTGYAPTVDAQSDVTIETQTGALVVTGYAPELMTRKPAPGTAALLLTGYAPTAPVNDRMTATVTFKLTSSYVYAAAAA